MDTASVQASARRGRPGIAVLLAALLGGCASYAPAPLDRGIVAGADMALLSRDAAAIDRPFLKPATIDLDAPLDDNAIAVLAVLGNPDLRALRVRAGVSDAQAFAARLLPDPTFSLGGDHILSGPDPVDAIAATLGFDLNALRTKKVVRAQSAAQAKQVRLDLAWSEWQTAGQARIQAARIRGLERGADDQKASAEAARRMLDRTLRAAGRGDLAADAVQGARTAAFDAEDRARVAERDLAAARLELTRLLGLPPETMLRIGAGPARDTAIDPARLTELATTRRADIAALRAGYDAQEAAVHKAVLDQFPTLALSIAGQRDTGGNVLLGPTVDFTLPLWNRNRGGIAIERATRAALKAEYESRLFQARAEIAAAASGIAVARRQRPAIAADMPALEKFAGASRRAADRGDLAPATAETAEAALRDKRIALAAIDQAIDEQMIALELLTGAPKEDW
jgi:cobalt-zinc-cadmium efflux system outer membrane protein